MTTPSAQTANERLEKVRNSIQQPAIEKEICRNSHKMGGGPEHFKEKVLIVLPVPEPKDILDSLRKEFPGLELTYFHINFKEKDSQHWAGVKKIPTGKDTLSPPEGPIEKTRDSRLR